MCKNAGKTTVLNQIIRETEQRGEILGLTSIGRDGERSDLVTNTKKPEIFVRRGALIATAEQALDLGTISREIVGIAEMSVGIPKMSLRSGNDISTPMGRIILARAMSDGFVQLAGPSMTVQLMRVRDMLFELGAKRVLLDGALSRKSLAAPTVSSGTILCTGASYSPDMLRTAEDTAYAARLMSLPRTELPFDSVTSKLSVYRDSRTEACADMQDVVDAVRKGGVKAVFIRGGITDAIASALMAAGRALNGIEIVCEDGSRLLLSRQNAEKLGRIGAGFTVLNTTRLLAVTVNPFSAYGNHYDKDAFMKAVRARIPAGVPVVNVLSKEFEGLEETDAQQ